MSEQPTFAFASDGVRCNRCGAPCKVGPPPKPEAQVIRRATKPSGVCVNCAATTALMNLYPVNMLLDEKGPECLLHPESRRQFGELLAVAHADAAGDEIDWEVVVANWDLPIVINRKDPINPYLPTHPRRSTREEQYEPERHLRGISAKRGRGRDGKEAETCD